MTKETKVVCPCCGAEFAIPANQFTVSNATVIGADSGLGIIHPTVVGENKSLDIALSRLMQMKAAGINTDNLFAMKNGRIGRITNNHAEVVDDTEFGDFTKDWGTIHDSRLYHQWMRAQNAYLTLAKGGFVANVRKKGYKYQWKLLLNMLRAEKRLQDNGNENYEIYSSWFNRTLFCSMLLDYTNQLIDTLYSAKRHTDTKHENKRYIHVFGHDVYVDDLIEKFMKKRDNVWVSVQNDTHCPDLSHLIDSVQYFMKNCIIPRSFNMSSAFLEAYKGLGAYYNIKEFILFDKCRIFPVKHDVDYCTDDSLKQLDILNSLYSKCNEGWRLRGVLKKMLRDNNIDLAEKRREWSKYHD